MSDFADSVTKWVCETSFGSDMLFKCPNFVLCLPAHHTCSRFRIQIQLTISQLTIFLPGLAAVVFRSACGLVESHSILTLCGIVNWTHNLRFLFYLTMEGGPVEGETTLN